MKFELSKSFGLNALNVKHNEMEYKVRRIPQLD